MEIRSYNHELEYANLLFSKLFRNITIEKQYGNKMKLVPVNCMIGNRSRIFKNLENPEKKATYTFPLLVVERTGINTEPDRIANLHNEVKYQTRPNGPNDINYYNLMTPNPVAINYTVTIISKDQATNDMIMSNFIPFFNQDLFVSSIHPKFTNVKYNSQVIFGGSITDEHPSELQGDDDDFVVTTCEFTFKTYIFGGTGRMVAGIHPGDGDDPATSATIYDGFVPIIKIITLDMHAVPYLDPVPEKYVTSVFYGKTSAALSNLEEGVDYSTALSDNLPYWYDTNNLSLYHRLSVETISGYYDPYTLYSIDKYFNDITYGRWWPQDVDTLRWRINDETQKFELLSTNWWWIPEGDFGYVKGINPYSPDTPISATFWCP